MEAISERNSPILQDVREGILTCSNCGNIYHSYFISKETRKLRDKLQAAAVVFQQRQAQKNFKYLQQARETYKKSFDADQVRYKEMVEKAAAQDGREP